VIFRKKEEPEPVIGTELTGRYEITFSGKQTEPFFGKIERITNRTIETGGEKHEINVFRFMSKRAGDEAFWYSIDQDISVEGETITMKDTILGSKRITRWAAVVMVLIDALFMYVMYSFASAGFVLQYSPMATLEMYGIVGAVFMGTVAFVIYWWYSSQVTVFSVDLRPLVPDYSPGLVPVYMTNSSRNPPEQYLLKLASLSPSVLEKLDESVKALSVELATAVARYAKETGQLVTVLKEAATAHIQNVKDVKVITRETSPRVVTSYLPVIISVIIIAIGFIAMYLVYG